jgi:ATP/maltotriose-dependent transcriptional regulator MalT
LRDFEHQYLSSVTTTVTGAEIWLPCFLALLAEAYAEAGRPDDALSSLNEALVIAGKHEERLYEAELHRLTGEYQLRQTTSSSDSGRSEAESRAKERFRHAIEVARAQQAKSRAAVGLGRLLQRQAGATRRGSSWPTSTAGSPRASTPRICGRRRPCSTRCRNRNA